MTATNQGLAVTWNASPLGNVMGGNFSEAMTTVDCTTLEDEAVDNRAERKDPSGNIVISLKDSNEPTPGIGDVGTLAVDGRVSGLVLITAADMDTTASGARALSLTFVSTVQGT